MSGSDSWNTTWKLSLRWQNTEINLYLFKNWQTHNRRRWAQKIQKAFQFKKKMKLKSQCKNLDLTAGDGDWFNMNLTAYKGNHDIIIITTVMQHHIGDRFVQRALKWSSSPLAPVTHLEEVVGGWYNGKAGDERKGVQEHERGFGVKTSQACSEMVVTDWASCWQLKHRPPPGCQCCQVTKKTKMCS